jgi:DNA primase
VNETLDPATYTMSAVVERVRRRGDLFAGVLATKQSLSAALRRLS